MHFTRVENFSTSVGGIIVTGSSSIGTALTPPQIRRLRLSANGMELSFHGRERAVLVTDDGIRHPLNIDGWAVKEESVEVRMNDGAGIVLLADPHNTAVQLVPIVPATVPAVRSLELPFRPQNGSQVSMNPHRPDTLSVTATDKEYVALIPRDSSWNPNTDRLKLVVLDKANPVLEIADAAGGGGLSVAEWLERAEAPSEGIFNSAVEQWLDAARSGWDARLGSRQISRRGTDETAVWSDVLAAAILSDAVMQDDLASRVQALQSAADGTPGMKDWLISPYTGDIINKTRIHVRDLSRRAQASQSGIESGSPPFDAVLPLSALLDFGSTADAAALVDAARRVPEPGTPNKEVFQRIRILHEARDLFLDNGAEDALLRKRYFDEFILPRVSWAMDGLWLLDNDASVDLGLSIAMADLMLAEALWNNDSRYQAVGRQLIVSALSHTDPEGRAPEKIFFENDGTALKEGNIAPELLYPYIADTPAYPRHVSLSGELGGGAWALTGAERFTLRSTPRETRVIVDFPPDSIHHLAIRGVKRFNTLYMNGIPWKSDPNFQRYYAGWAYEESTETLFIKIRHRVKTETIRILHYNPDVPTPPESE